MARYRVLQKSFIDNRIVEEGEIIDYDPPEGGVAENLEPIRGKRGQADADPGTGDEPA